MKLHGFSPLRQSSRFGCEGRSPVASCVRRVKYFPRFYVVVEASAFPCYRAASGSPTGCNHTEGASGRYPPEIQSIKDRLASLEGQITGLEGRLTGEIRSLRSEIERLDNKIDNGLARLDQKIDALRNEFKADIARLEDKLSAQVARLDEKLTFTNKRLGEALEIRERLAALEAKVGR